MSKRYKVIFWGPGNIGGTALRMALERPEFEVVGAKVWSPDKDGVDVAELVGAEAIGVKATTDTDELVALDADCVVHTPVGQPLLNEIDADVIRLLESGKNLVSTQSYHYPAGRELYPEWREAESLERLEEACQTGGVTLHGAGIHPSFVFERLVMTLTGLLTGVDHVRIVESANAIEPSSVMSPFVQQLLGFGADPAIVNTDFPGAIGTDPYYKEVICYAGDRLFGAGVQDIRFEHEYKGLPGDGEFDVGGHEVKPGTVQRVCIIHRGYLGDHHFFTNEEYWYMGAQNRYFGEAAPPFGPTTSTHDYIIELKGKPADIRMQMDLESTMPDDLPVITYASAVTLLQAIVPVTDAEPGILYHEAAPHAAPDYRQAAAAHA